jgi:alanine dehydrogenase
MLIVSRAEVETVLDLDMLRNAVAAAMIDVSAGNVSMPPRIAARVDDDGALLAAMPAYLRSRPALATKLVSVFPQNAHRALPTHQAIIVVFDPANGTAVALLDGTYITAARTAAASALSVDCLARPGARTLAILGTGVQARSHARAVTRVRDFAEIRVAGRNHETALRLVEELSTINPGAVRAAPSYEEACAGADVICACTHAVEPVVLSRYVADGTHVTSVGYNVAGREVDVDTIARALLVVESREAVLAAAPSGSNDLRVAIETGRIDAGHIHAELGEVLAGSRPGRTSAEQVTLYKSVGIAAQDVAAATVALDAARAAGLGTEVPI